MKTHDVELLPITLKKSLELMTLLVEAKRLQTKFSTIIQYHDLDNETLLYPFIKQESFKSCQLAGNQIRQSDLYYINYLDEDDDVVELMNYIKVLTNVYDYVSEDISLKEITKINRVILNSKRGSRRNPGVIRNEVLWIGQRGSSMDKAEYVPIDPSKIDESINNLLEYFNTQVCVDDLSDIAITHAQFENIHPFKDGNGRTGRILVPIQGILRKQNYLFLSETIKGNEYSYYNRLKDSRNNRLEQWVKFFFEIMIKQYQKNIDRLDEVVTLYRNDKPRFEEILPKCADKVLNYLIKNISTTIQEMSDTLGIDYQTSRNYLNKLQKKSILSKHKIRNGKYVYIYINMYQIHVPVDWV